VVWSVVVRLIRPARVRNAAVHAAHHDGVTPLVEPFQATPAR
jgi:hypothetical protein